LYYGAHGFAGSAPVGVKIYQYRHARAIDEFRKRFLWHFFRLKL